MSNIIDIKELQKQYNNKMNLKQLQEYTKAQYLALMGAAKALEELQEKNKHLEQLLQGMVPSNSRIELGSISAEEAICIQQIKILEEKSSKVELNPEETRKFDIFVKNLRLIRENAPKKDIYEDLNMDEESLISLVRGED